MGVVGKILPKEKPGYSEELTGLREKDSLKRDARSGTDMGAICPSEKRSASILS